MELAPCGTFMDVRYKSRESDANPRKDIFYQVLFPDSHEVWTENKSWVVIPVPTIEYRYRCGSSSDPSFSYTYHVEHLFSRKLIDQTRYYCTSTGYRLNESRACGGNAKSHVTDKLLRHDRTLLVFLSAAYRRFLDVAMAAIRKRILSDARRPYDVINVVTSLGARARLAEALRTIHQPT